MTWLRAMTPATKHDLDQVKKEIMSAITDWAAKEDADLTAINATLDGIVTGVAGLDELIKQLQNSPGTLSPEDQAVLDRIEAASAALVTKAGAIDTSAPKPPTT